jgi:hypothetical protein
LVVNPFADRLTFLDDRTRTRRDHEKYLTLIDAITLLHQHQRPIRKLGDIAASIQNRDRRSLFGPAKPRSSPRPWNQNPGRRAGRQRMDATAATAKRRGATHSRPFAGKHGERP